MKKEKTRYTSDLTDEEWEILEPLIPVSKRGRPRKIVLREIVNAILYIVKTGVQWRNLPKDFPNYNSVYYYFRKWRLDNTWNKINNKIRSELRKELERNEEPSAAIIDSQSVKGTEMCGHISTFDGGKKVKGLKIHILTDTQGFLLKVYVHPANIPDCIGGRKVLTDITNDFPELKVIFADGGYPGLHNWVSLDSKGKVRVEIIKRLDSKEIGDDKQLKLVFDKDQPVIEKAVKMNNNDGKFPILQWRWIVERTLSWLSMIVV
jgi:putative transposase